MRPKLNHGALLELAERKLNGAFGTRKYDDVAHEFGTTGVALRNAVWRMRRMRVDWESHAVPPKPAIWYAFKGARPDRKIHTLNDSPELGQFPCAVIPCRTLAEARALLRRCK